MIRISLIALAFAATAHGQLPSNYQLDRDWLLATDPAGATITKDENTNRVTLSNGLISRTIDLKSGTTIAFDNLMTGETVIRAITPEGSVTIDGTTYPIGGLDGQPNRAFLTPAFLAGMKPAKNALTLIGSEVGPAKPRMKWTRTRHHAPNAVWPPKGRYLRLDYTAPQPSADDLLTDAVPASDLGRKLLFADSFETMDASWNQHTSKAHPRSSFVNEGKPGEIYTPANTAVFVERPLPAGTRLVEATFHPGTDQSASWAPGIGLVDPDRVIKFTLREADKLCVTVNGREHLGVNGNDKIDPSLEWTLRMRLVGDQILFDAKPKGGGWKNYHRLQVPGGWKPAAIRVGKMDKSGGASDHQDKGDLVRLKINRVAIHGAFDPSKLAALQDESPLKGVHVSVHYEIYDGIPVLQKWITVENTSGRTINLDRFNAETLSVVERDSQVESRDGVSVPAPRSLHVETDMAFGGMMHRNANRHTVHWRTEKSYTSQVNYRKETPCRLMVEPTFGPDQTILDGDGFHSFRVFELVHDSEDRERRGLSLRRMYRTVAPWITENPLMMHVVSSNPDVVRRAVDQAAAVGFEMVIISFGSGFNAESTDPAYLAKWKGIVDDAHSKDIQMGCYSLYSSRRIGGGNAIVPPEGMRCAHGNCPAITSEWGQAYIKKLYNLFDTVGFDLFENDGPYPGDVDTTARPPLQKGVNDSRWVHWRTWTKFYGHLRDRGVYLNLPDYYYLSGSNKCGMGYREVNWSLPRAQQRIHTRQNIYDGTWQKTPSMGWMFVPLTQYHGGGAAATIEPLNQHLKHYETMMLSNLGLGVQACYRGPRLYDTDATREMVTNTVAWFKKHRDILESDLIHGRRADGRDLDWMLHVNPTLDTKGLLAVYNPTDQEITKTIRIPLYYTGLTKTAMVAKDDGNPRKALLDPHQRAQLTITVPPNGFSWFTFTN